MLKNTDPDVKTYRFSELDVLIQPVLKQFHSVSRLEEVSSEGSPFVLWRFRQAYQVVVRLSRSSDLQSQMYSIGMLKIQRYIVALQR